MALMLKSRQQPGRRCKQSFALPLKHNLIFINEGNRLLRRASRPSFSTVGGSATALTTDAQVSAPKKTAAPEPAPGAAHTPLDRTLWERNWIPVAPLSCLDPAKPMPITLLGHPLVLWHHATRGWVVMADACPHRLAPLSEGRLEAGGTRLACAYHGWEFSATGACTKVPQLAADERAAATACASPRSCVTSYPTLVEDGLLFTWLDASREGLAAAQAAPPPRLLDEGATPASQWLISESPIDYSYWIEQGFDPGHANFLHHGRGFYEENSIPMWSNMVKDVDLAGGYVWEHGPYDTKDLGSTTRRELLPPFTNRWRVTQASGRKQHFCVMVVPVRPGVSRTYFKVGFSAAATAAAAGPSAPEAAAATAPPRSSPPASTNVPETPQGPTGSSARGGTAPGDAGSPSNGVKPAAGAGGSGSSGRKSGNLLLSDPLKLLTRLPHWAFNGDMLDQDVVIICRQEQLMRRQGLTPQDYNLNSPSDHGLAAIRAWLRLADYPTSLWGDKPASAFTGQTYPGWPAQDVPLEVLLSRHDRHIRHCAECQRGLKLVTRVCTALSVAAALAASAAAAVAMVAAISPQGAAAVGGWGWVVGVAVGAVGLAVAAVKSWEFREERFVSGAKQWRRIGGYAGFKMPKK